MMFIAFFELREKGDEALETFHLPGPVIAIDNRWGIEPCLRAKPKDILHRDDCVFGRKSEEIIDDLLS